MGTYLSYRKSRKDNNICMFPASLIHCHLCKSAGDITDCHNPSKLTIVIWLLMLSLYCLVPPGQYIICTVIFTSGIGSNAGDCVTTMLYKKCTENVVKPRAGMKISWSQFRVDQVVMCGEWEKTATLRLHLFPNTVLRKTNVNLLRMKLAMCSPVPSSEGRQSWGELLFWGKKKQCCQLLSAPSDSMHIYRAPLHR